MSRTFRTVGSGNTQSLEPIENNKIPVYETKTAAETDLPNLSVGQIIATKDEGNELPNPVDVVESGNLHAVTSNAVYNAVKAVDITSSVTKDNTYVDALSVIRAGNVIDIYFTTKSVDTVNAIGATNLPKPKSNMLAYGTETYTTGTIVHTRVEGSALIVQCSNTATGAGHVTYICE